MPEHPTAATAEVEERVEVLDGRAVLAQELADESAWALPVRRKNSASAWPARSAHADGRAEAEPRPPAVPLRGQLRLRREGELVRTNGRSRQMILSRAVEQLPSYSPARRLGHPRTLARWLALPDPPNALLLCRRQRTGYFGANLYRGFTYAFPVCCTFWFWRS